MHCLYTQSLAFPDIQGDLPNRLEPGEPLPLYQKRKIQDKLRRESCIDPQTRANMRDISILPTKLRISWLVGWLVFQECFVEIRTVEQSW
jgi:hypothetical protein